jgi:hypothetical protein
MKKRLHYLLCLLLLAIISALTSCNRQECKNTNPVFEKNAPDSRDYKKELAKLLKSTDRAKLRYWLDRYEEKHEQGYMRVNVQGADICAIAVLTVQNWKGIENIKKWKGMGYRGAELVNLGIEIYQDSVNTEFFYTGLEKIID